MKETGANRQDERIVRLSGLRLARALRLRPCSSR